MTAAKNFKNQEKAFDFSYLQKYGNKITYKFPTLIESYTRGQKLQARVTYYYDPSKFWFVTKYKELQSFQKRLFKFYYLNQNTYRIPTNKIAVNDFCVAFIFKTYCRGVIVKIYVNYIEGDKPLVEVYLLDYGNVCTVTVNDLYYMNEVCFKIPQFAIRGSLTHIRPCGNTWTKDAINYFKSLCYEQTCVVCIEDIDCERNVLCVQLGSREVGIVHKLLVEKQYAQYLDQNHRTKKEDKIFEPVRKYSYLFPSQEVLENGHAPSLMTVDVDYRLQVAPLTVNERYFKMK